LSQDADEIVFDEVRYREPERLCRPDRDRRLASMAYELPAHGELPIFLDRKPADAIERHALRDTTVELGGILLGKECLDDQSGLPFVWITESLEAKHYENTQASFTYTHDSWEEITRERDRLHPELDIVGWYHTHPDFGVFLSSHDLFIHRHFFAQPLQVAYVVDPIRQTRGFFQWRGDAVAQVGGFYLTAARDQRQALARLVNDLESIPNTDGGGGGGFSPRLEAELMALLTRNAAPPATTADRTLVATLFSMLGMMAGVLGVLGVLWLNQLARSVQDQHARIDEVARTVERSSAAQRLALETLLESAHATDHDPEAFLTRVARMTRERDELRAKLDQQATINGELATRKIVQDRTNADLKKELGFAAALAQRYEKDAKEADDLRTKLDELTTRSDLQAQKLAEQEHIVDTVEGRKAGALLRSYDRAWYVAAAGWCVALFLALGLAATLGLRPPGPSEDESEAGPGVVVPRPEAEGGSGDEPHHIT
jgi:proteasome lid subunit RPN8/RPN11